MGDNNESAAELNVQNIAGNHQPSTSRGMGQLEVTSDVFYIDTTKVFQSQPAVCNGCNARGRTVKINYNCLQCVNYHLCEACNRDAATIHPNHMFESVDLWSLIQQHRLSTRPPDCTPTSTRYIQVSTKEPCPTCLDHRPQVSDQSDSSSSSSTQTSWMSNYEIYVSDLRDSYTRGCDMCSIIYRGLLSVQPVLCSEDRRLQVIISRDGIKVGDTSGKRSALYDMWTFRFHGGPNSRPPYHTLKPASVFADRFDSEACFQKIRDCTKDCEENHAHPDCKRNADAVLPRRVLEITTNGENASMITLALRETNGEWGRYIALSHRWGATPVVSTTMANIERMKQGIDIESLPKTFKDAIHFARKLDFDYIWIDSLCIIQENMTDWEIQSSKMASIYSNAYFVLVAASAAGDTKGFLHEREKRYQGIPLEALEGSGIHEICVHEIMPHPGHRDSTGVKSHMLDSQVDERAWIMQETVLARRVGYIYASEMVWECNSNITCECGLAPLHMGRAAHYRLRVTKDKRQVEFRFPTKPDRSDNSPAFTLANSSGDPFKQSLKFEANPRPFARLVSLEATYDEWRLK